MNTTQPIDRWRSLDALRAVAVILMLEQHLGVWFTALVVRGRPVSGWMILLNQLGGLAAPLFIVISAFGAALRKGRAPVATLTRGLGLMVLGTCLHLLVPSWFSPASFYILSLLGLATLSTIALRPLPNWAVLGIGIAILVLTPIGQSYLKLPYHLPTERMRGDSLSYPAVRLALFEGHFPIFPWLGLFVLAFSLGRWTAESLLSTRPRIEHRPALFLWVGTSGAMMTGLLLLLLGSSYRRSLMGTSLGRAARFSFYPASPSFLLIVGGLASLLCLLCLWAESRRAFRPPEALLALGRISLTITLVHIVFFKEALSAYHRSLTPVYSLSLIAALIISLTLLARLWARFNYRFSFEWLLSSLVGRVSEAAKERESRASG